MVPDDEALRLGKEQTITVWMNPTAPTGDWCRLVGKGEADPRNYGLWRSDAGFLLYQIYGPVASANAWEDGNPVTEAPLGEWTHMAGVYDAATMKLYVNGVEVASTDYAEDPHTSEDPLTFGYTGSFHGPFRGSIDEIGIFNAPLSEGDINTIMNDGLGAVVNLTAVSSGGKLTVTWGGIKEEG